MQWAHQSHELLGSRTSEFCAWWENIVHCDLLQLRMVAILCAMSAMLWLLLHVAVILWPAAISLVSRVPIPFHPCGCMGGSSSPTTAHGGRPMLQTTLTTTTPTTTRTTQPTTRGSGTMMMKKMAVLMSMLQSTARAVCHSKGSQSGSQAGTGVSPEECAAEVTCCRSIK